MRQSFPRKLWLVALVWGSLSFLGAENLPAPPLDSATALQALDFAQTQLAATVAQYPASARRYPKATSASGAWQTISASDVWGWTQGFYPGSLWFLYEMTGQDRWKQAAQALTAGLENQKNNTTSMDTSFKIFASYGNGFRLTHDPADRAVLLTAAASFATLYRDKLGMFDTGHSGWNSDWTWAVFIDCMPELELMFWAAQNGGPAQWYDMALSHALKTRQDLVRPDGSVFHLADYATSGKMIRPQTWQGFADNTTWSRGQSWAVYGFTMAYRFTHDARLLETAQKTADYFLDHLPADQVPAWDFQAPPEQTQPDSSAAAVVASGLLELKNYVADPQKAARYTQAAQAILQSLATKYLAQGSKVKGILLHGVGSYPHGKEIDVATIYGDYYFLEALARWLDPQRVPAPAWK